MSKQDLRGQEKEMLLMYNFHLFFDSDIKNVLHCSKIRCVIKK